MSSFEGGNRWGRTPEIGSMVQKGNQIKETLTFKQGRQLPSPRSYKNLNQVCMGHFMCPQHKGFSNVWPPFVHVENFLYLMYIRESTFTFNDFSSSFWILRVCFFQSQICSKWLHKSRILTICCTNMWPWLYLILHNKPHSSALPPASCNFTKTFTEVSSEVVSVFFLVLWEYRRTNITPTFPEVGNTNSRYNSSNSNNSKILSLCQGSLCFFWKDKQ